MSIVEVLVDDPVLRLLRMRVLGPLVDEFPYVTVQRIEDHAGHTRPVVGRPPLDDGVELGSVLGETSIFCSLFERI